jgi:hypothetical protein
LEAAMSDRITWGICPTCGSRAAIGWEAIGGPDGETLGGRPLELNCVGGCEVTAPEQLAALQQ